jgi:transcription termination factor Rho
VSVLQRKELEGSPLADLHAIASELGLEGFRAMRREDLVTAILDAQGGEEAEPAGEPGGAEPEDEVEPVEQAPEEEALEEEAAEEGEPEEVEEPPEEEPQPVEEEPEVEEEPVAEEEIVTGVLDILPNGSGFIRVNPGEQSREDVYISPAQIRRCELRAGDEVSGPERPPRRNERHPSLVRVENVNGGPAEPPEERPRFSDLTAVFPGEPLKGPAAIEGLPFGMGSRVAISGPPGSGATTLLRELVASLAENHPDLDLQVVLVAVRPEEVTQWQADARAPVSGGSFDRSLEAQAQAAELAVERAKRRAERGGNAAVVIDSLETLPAAVQRRVFGAGRATQEGGTLTLIAATGTAVEPLRWATARVVLQPPGA